MHTGGRATAAMLTVLVLFGLPGCRPAAAASWVPAAQGAYLGPGPKGAGALPGWDDWSGMSSVFGSDFESADGWPSIEGQDWLLGAWQASGRRLMLGVPMFPVGPAAPPASLAACAAGSYDRHWRVLADNLVGHQLSTTVLRPGWEFNGDWFGWGAKGHETDFAGCFRRLVLAMRASPGQRFRFIWNVSIGSAAFPAELAFPGRDVVDAIGVDVYDLSWLPDTYPIPAHATEPDRAARHARAWAGLCSGDHGLAFWATFARRAGLRLTLPEWGLSERPDGHGGGDDPSFVDRMLDFIDDPANLVSMAMYFNADAGDKHRLIGDGAMFPVAATRLQDRLRN